jgi:manganese/zinc/iron transport system permease protein
LVSDAIAHAALPGICVAFIVLGEREFLLLLLGAFIFGLLAAASISLVRRFSRIKDDAATALAIGGFFGFGVVLSRIIQNDPSGNRAGLDSFIFGKAASLVASDVL